MFCTAQEMYFRHLYAIQQPPLEARAESWANYTALFGVILHGNVNMQLPNGWLWDMIDEFVYQFQSFAQYRGKLSMKSAEEVRQCVALSDCHLTKAGCVNQRCCFSASRGPPALAMPWCMHFIMDYIRHMVFHSAAVACRTRALQVSNPCTSSRSIACVLPSAAGAAAAGRRRVEHAGRAELPASACRQVRHRGGADCARCDLVFRHNMAEWIDPAAPALWCMRASRTVDLTCMYVCPENSAAHYLQQTACAFASHHCWWRLQWCQSSQPGSMGASSGGGQPSIQFRVLLAGCAGGAARLKATEGFLPQQSNVLRMLGYFSLVGLQRVHALVGDYHGALKVCCFQYV